VSRLCDFLGPNGFQQGWMVVRFVSWELVWDGLVLIGLDLEGDARFSLQERRIGELLRSSWRMEMRGCVLLECQTVESLFGRISFEKPVDST